MNPLYTINPNITVINNQDANAKFLLAAWPNVAHLYSSLPLSATQLDAALHLTPLDQPKLTRCLLFW